LAIGTICDLFPDRGFGFVREDGKTEELYFHWSSLQAGNLDQLAVGQRVSFDIRPDPRDPSRSIAVDLKLY
jgi:CspA family cold shock protein